MSGIAFSQEYKVIRNNSSGSYVNGKYVEGTTEEFYIQGSAQPVTGEELLNLPEAQRKRGVIKLYTQTKLNVVDTNNKRQCDLLEYRDENYEVHEVKDYSDYFFTHYKILLIKIEDNKDERIVN